MCLKNSGTSFYFPAKYRYKFVPLRKNTPLIKRSHKKEKSPTYGNSPPENHFFQKRMSFADDEYQ